MITVIVPYYNQPHMLAVQLDNYNRYDPFVQQNMKLIVVDDGSAVSALEVIRTTAWFHKMQAWKAEVYRITVDIPWNRGEARNIGAKEAITDWILQIDIDHILPREQAIGLVAEAPSLSHRNWFRFRRFRNGAADHTRKKDAIPTHARYGEIKPHVDSYLCTREMYWKAGGYNEDFSGCLGGGSPFLKFMTEITPPMLLPYYLEVHTTDKTSDASADLDRTPGEYTRRRQALEKAGKLKGHDPFRQPYERVL